MDLVIGQQYGADALNYQFGRGGTAFLSAPSTNFTPAAGSGFGGDSGDLFTAFAKPGGDGGFIMWFGAGVLPPGNNDLTLVDNQVGQTIWLLAEGHGTTVIPGADLPRNATINWALGGPGGRGFRQVGGGAGEVLFGSFTNTSGDISLVLPHAPPKLSAEPAWDSALTVGSTPTVIARYGLPANNVSGGRAGASGNENPGSSISEQGGRGGGGTQSASTSNQGGIGLEYNVGDVESFMVGFGGDGRPVPIDRPTSDGGANTSNGGSSLNDENDNTLAGTVTFGRGGGGFFVLWYTVLDYATQNRYRPNGFLQEALLLPGGAAGSVTLVCSANANNSVGFEHNHTVTGWSILRWMFFNLDRVAAADVRNALAAGVPLQTIARVLSGMNAAQRAALALSLDGIVLPRPSLEALWQAQ